MTLIEHCSSAALRRPLARASTGLDVSSKSSGGPTTTTSDLLWIVGVGGRGHFARWERERKGRHRGCLGRLMLRFISVVGQTRAFLRSRFDQQ